jgi:hypothetical protein
MVAGMLSRYFAMRFLAYSRLAHWRHRARAFVTVSAADDAGAGSAEAAGRGYQSELLVPPAVKTR